MQPALLKSFLLYFVLASASAYSAEPVLAVVEKVAGQVGFYTPEGKRVSGVKVGEHPHEILLSPDGKYLYVSNNGILWMEYAGAGGNTISVIDAETHKLVKTIKLGEYRRPHGMDVDPKTGNLVVTIENPDGLLLVDPKAGKVIRKYDTKGGDPHMVMLGPDGKWAYVSNVANSTVGAVNLETGEVKLIPTGERPQGGVLSKDRKLYYLTASNGNAISIIDLEKKQQVGSIKVAKAPGRAALTPDGMTLVHNCENCVGIVDLAKKKQTAVIPLSSKPLSLTLSPDGKTAYAGLQEIDKIAVVSIPDRKVVRHIQTPKQSGPDPVLDLSARR